MQCIKQNIKYINLSSFSRSCTWAKQPLAFQCHVICSRRHDAHTWADVAPPGNAPPEDRPRTRATPALPLPRQDMLGTREYCDVRCSIWDVSEVPTHTMLAMSR